MESETNQELAFQTERLLIKLLDPTSIPQVIEYFDRNKENFLVSLAEYPPDFFTELFQTEKFWKEFQLLTEGVAVRFYIFYKEDFFYKKIIGDISISNILRGGFQSCNIGCRIDSDESKKGLMTEAFSEIIKFIFNDMKLHRIEADILPTNIASKRLVEKLGFVQEGISRGFMRLNNKWQDHEKYSLINSD